MRELTFEMLVMRQWIMDGEYQTDRAGIVEMLLSPVIGHYDERVHHGSEVLYGL